MHKKLEDKFSINGMNDSAGSTCIATKDPDQQNFLVSWIFFFLKCPHNVLTYLNDTVSHKQENLFSMWSNDSDLL